MKVESLKNGRDITYNAPFFLIENCNGVLLFAKLMLISNVKI